MIVREIECPMCHKKAEVEIEERTSEYWHDGIPYPDRQWYMMCPICGDEMVIMDWEALWLKDATN